MSEKKDIEVVGLALFCAMVLAAYEIETIKRDIPEDEFGEWITDTVDSVKELVTGKLGRTLDLSA